LVEKLNEQHVDGNSWEVIEVLLTEHGVDAEKKDILKNLYETHEDEIKHYGAQ
jgi:hypothetical protein